MALTKDDIKELLTATENRLQATFKTEIEGAEKRLKVKIVSERTTLQIFFDQQLRQTKGLLEDVAHQLKETHTAVIDTLGKQADLEARVEKLEQHVQPPL